MPALHSCRMGLRVRPLFPAQSVCSTHSAQAAQCPQTTARPWGFQSLGFILSWSLSPGWGSPQEQKCQGQRDSPRIEFPWGRQGWVSNPQGRRDTSPSPHPVIQPNQEIAPCLTIQKLNPPMQERNQTCNRGSCGSAPAPVVLHRALHSI